LQEDLAIFVLAIGLSLAGIVVGIVARTRAFLYAGVAFLVVNVVGQLVLQYPEQVLARALLLMGLGTVIMAAMFWFNLKREAFMARIRIVRADLASWD
jgi:predicted transporter